LAQSYHWGFLAHGQNGVKETFFLGGFGPGPGPTRLKPEDCEALGPIVGGTGGEQAVAGQRPTVAGSVPQIRMPSPRSEAAFFISVNRLHLVQILRRLGRTCQ